MRNKLLRLVEEIESNNYVITVDKIESFLGREKYVRSLGNFKRIWIYENELEREMVYLTIRFGPYSDTVEVLDFDIFGLGL